MFPARAVSKECPFWERHVTLGRVKDGVITFAQSKGEKHTALRHARTDLKEGAIYFLAWTGRWTTDLFNVTEENLIDWIVEG